MESLTLQEIAEEPTGAFPSSHVGIILILAYLCYKEMPKLFWVTLPFAIAICFATVYLKAHYLIDVIAGIISVPVIFKLSDFIYRKLSKT